MPAEKLPHLLVQVPREALGQALRALKLDPGIDDPAKIFVLQSNACDVLQRALDGAESFQARVKPWMHDCFGPVVAGDIRERHHRFLEEALELAQASLCTKEEAIALVDYVYARPIGMAYQEVGGVMVTLAALCLARGLDMHAAGEAELDRVWQNIDGIRAKWEAKPKHGPLPGGVDQVEARPRSMLLPAELDKDLLEILGMPNFQCAPIAHAMQATGAPIARKAEAEQAHVLWKLLGFYAQHGADWRAAAYNWIEELQAEVKTKRAAAAASQSTEGQA